MVTVHPSVAPATYLIRLSAPALPKRELKRRIMEALQSGGRRIVVDCSEWLQLDLVLLSALVACAAVCATNEVSFELTNLSDDMRRRIVALHLADRLGLGPL